LTGSEKSGGKQGRAHLFKPGQSGNPKGKPRGARHRLTLLAEKLMDDQAEAIVESVIKAAKAGDMVAARLILERVSPVRKGRTVQFALPAVEKADDVLGALGSVIAAVASGELTPDEGATIAGLLEAKRRAIETVEFENRILALEEKK